MPAVTACLIVCAPLFAAGIKLDSLYANPCSRSGPAQPIKLAASGAGGGAADAAGGGGRAAPHAGAGPQCGPGEAPELCAHLHPHRCLWWVSHPSRWCLHMTAGSAQGKLPHPPGRCVVQAVLQLCIGTEIQQKTKTAQIQSDTGLFECLFEQSMHCRLKGLQSYPGRQGQVRMFTTSEAFCLCLLLVPSACA